MSDRRRVTALLAALLLTFAACGGDDDSEDADAPSEEGADATDSGNDTADDEATEAGDEGDESGETSDSVPGTIDATGLEGFCREAVEARNMSNNAGAQTDTDQAAQDFAETHEIMVGIDPPDEVADDWATVTEFIGAFGDALANGSQGELEARSEEFSAAGGRIDLYLTEECGVDLG